MSENIVLSSLGLTAAQVRNLTRKGAVSNPAPVAMKDTRDPKLLDKLAKAGCRPEMTCSVLLDVGPDLAKAWLSNNAGNRKPSQAKIKRFAAMMADGQWEQNGETLKFCESGRLLDGQSRLQAILLCGETVRLEARFGLPAKAQESMDTGEARSIAHTLQMKGYSQHNNVASALRLLHMYLCGRLTFWSVDKGVRKDQYYFTNTQALELIEQHKELIDAVRHADGKIFTKWVPKSKLAFLFYVFMRADAEKFATFRDAFATGAGLAAGHPILALRQRFMMAEAGEELELRAKLAIIIKAWNAYCAGKDLQILTWKDKEPFQPIAGCQLAGTIKHL